MLRADFDALKAEPNMVQAALNTIEMEWTDKVIAHAVDGVVMAARSCWCRATTTSPCAARAASTTSRSSLTARRCLLVLPGLDKKVADPARQWCQ